MDFLLLTVGFLLLLFGGEMVVHGSVSVAARLGVSPLIIGITLLGFATSAPELVTCVQAALTGHPDLAIGNVVGSNVTNILLILGICAVIAPLSVARASLARDGGIGLLAALVFWILSYVYPLDRIVGTIFLAGLLGYLVYAVVDDGRRERERRELEDIEAPIAKYGVFVSLLVTLVGLAVLVGGGKLVVDGAVGVAQTYGLSESVIGLTVVAIGTSLPELATSAVATLRRHTDLAIGNVLGSNIYNILGIAGTTALLAPTNVPDDLVRFDNYILVLAAFAVVAFAWPKTRLNRWHGVLFVLGYAGFIWAQVMKTQGTL